MKDRLSQIWEGFSHRSSIDLRGASIQNTPRPELSQRNEGASLGLESPLNISALPEGATDPVGVALTALQSQLEAKPKGRRAQEKHVPAMSSFTPPPSTVEKTLLADLAFTESKTNRSVSDYLRYAADRQHAWQRKKRKKFLGLF